MINRTAEKELRSLAKQFKAVAVVGPRQSGKTTLCRHVFGDRPYVNLENPDERSFAISDPRGFLAQYAKGALIDEVQRAPEIFSYLQQILDEQTEPGRFILTGSNNFLIQQNISQSLAGRIAYQYLLPFSIEELPGKYIQDLHSLLITGFYPPLFDQPVTSRKWLPNYVSTYIERDVRQIKNITDLNTFERFLKLCAGRIGQLLNMNNLAVETGVDNKTISSWISILENSFILFRLQPHHANFNKRIVKMPKLYFYDTGLAAYLLDIRDPEQLKFHPLSGSLFENFVISELQKQIYNKGKDRQLWFWRDNTGHEIDVVIEKPGVLFPLEIKSGMTITPEYFKGLLFWQKISGTKPGMVIYAGDSNRKRTDGITVIGWKELKNGGVV